MSSGLLALIVRNVIQGSICHATARLHAVASGDGQFDLQAEGHVPPAAAFAHGWPILAVAVQPGQVQLYNVKRCLPAVKLKHACLSLPLQLRGAPGGIFSIAFHPSPKVPASPVSVTGTCPRATCQPFPWRLEPSCIHAPPLAAALVPCVCWHTCRFCLPAATRTQS